MVTQVGVGFSQLANPLEAGTGGGGGQAWLLRLRKSLYEHFGGKIGSKLRQETSGRVLLRLPKSGL